MLPSKDTSHKNAVCKYTSNTVPHLNLSKHKTREHVGSSEQKYALPADLEV